MNEANLQGLLIPPEPEGFNSILWLSILLGIGLIVILLWYWQAYKKKPTTVALKQLDLLNQKENLSQHTKLIQLVSILCQGLKIKRLDQYKPTNIDAWKSFQLSLDTACYASGSEEIIDTQLFDSLLNEAKQWLRNE